MLTNILLDNLPKTTPNGYKIKTSFKQAIKFELLMQDKSINDDEKVALALSLFYDNLEDVNKQLEDILWFYSQGRTNENEHKSNKNNCNIQIYSFEFDSGYIYSAFIEQYGIDLTKVDLHWWSFKYLFESLSSKTKFVEIMGYRSIDINKITDKEERKRYNELKKIYALPDMRTAEEKENDFNAMFW